MHEKLILKDRHYSWIFLAPAILILILFTVYPLIYSLTISFYGWNLTRPGSAERFIGFTNYINILKNSDFWNSVLVTAKFTVFSTGGTMVVGTALAFLLFQRLIGTHVVRTFAIAAMILAPIVVGTAWRIMYNTNYGIINYFLEVLKIGGRPFLSDTSLVIPALVLTDVWQWSPLVMIIVLAALQGLPEEVYEAGKVDGASTWQVFWHITLPLLKPSLTLALLIRLMDSFRTFDIIYAMTAGGPGTSSQNLNILMYNTGFEYFQVSKTAALAIISLILIIIASLSIIKVLRKEGTEIW